MLTVGRFVWIVTWDRDRPEGDPSTTPRLIRWAIVGLAVVGIVAVVAWKLFRT